MAHCHSHKSVFPHAIQLLKSAQKAVVKALQKNKLCKQNRYKPSLDETQCCELYDFQKNFCKNKQTKTAIWIDVTNVSVGRARKCCTAEPCRSNISDKNHCWPSRFLLGTWKIEITHNDCIVIKAESRQHNYAGPLWSQSSLNLGWEVGYACENHSRNGGGEDRTQTLISRLVSHWRFAINQTFLFLSEHASSQQVSEVEQTGKTHNSCEEFKIWEVIWTNIKEHKYNAKGHHLVYLIGLFSTVDSSCAFLSLFFFFKLFKCRFLI